MADSFNSAEEQLIGRALTGDAAAFEEIIRLYERQVYRTTLRLLGDTADAEDAAQEVFLRVYRYLNRFSTDRPLGPWIYAVSVNICRDFVARRRPVAEIDSNIRENRANPEELALHGEQKRWVEQALEKLPPGERAAIVLRDMEGLATREVAGILRLSEATVRSQISSARLKMRALWKKLQKRGTA